MPSGPARVAWAPSSRRCLRQRRLRCRWGCSPGRAPTALGVDPLVDGLVAPASPRPRVPERSSPASLWPEAQVCALRAPRRPGISSGTPGAGTCLPDARRQSPGGAHARRCARRRQLLEAARPSRRAAASNDSPRPIPARISSRSSALNGLPGMMGPLPVVGSGSLGRDGRTLATTGGTRLRSRKSERLERVP